MITTMDAFYTQLITAICVASIVFVALRYRRPALPPGPRGWPIIGSLLDLPKEFEWLYWGEYRKYGPVSSTTVLGKHIIILNTLDVCVELLERRSSIYSGRPRMPFAGELVGWDQQLVFSPYNRHFRAMRKLAQSQLGTKAAASKYYDIIQLETKYLILRLHRDPEGLAKHIRTTLGAILLRMSHGYITRTDGQDPFINMIEIAAKDFYDATKPGRWLVDILPWMKHIPDWVPGTYWKRVASTYRKVNEDQTNLPYEFVLKGLRNGTAAPSFTANALQSGQLGPEERYALKFIAAALFGGGLDTMASSASTFFLAMVLFPHVQRKAQEEIDRVVGRDRLPNLKDNLPYISATLKEIYRWRPVGPLGIPHATTQDDVYNGYFIPKGSIVIDNIWEIGHDEVHYHNPESFNPERFLGETPELDPENFVFGFGRRICPGIQVVHPTMFMIMATCLSLFDIQSDSARDEWLTGTVLHPKPFKCAFKPRNASALHLIGAIDSELADVQCVPSEL